MRSMLLGSLVVSFCFVGCGGRTGNDEEAVSAAGGATGNAANGGSAGSSGSSAGKGGSTSSGGATAGGSGSSAAGAAGGAGKGGSGGAGNGGSAGNGGLAGKGGSAGSAGTSAAGAAGAAGAMGGKGGAGGGSAGSAGVSVGGASGSGGSSGKGGTQTGGAGGSSAGAGGSGGLPGLCGTIVRTPCPTGFFCEFQDKMCGGADGEGQCVQIPTSCPKPLVQAICGCDGQVHFGSACDVHAAGVDVWIGGCRAPTDAFPCGDRFCGALTQYCHVDLSDTGGPDNYLCLALPDACQGAQPTCDCVADEPCGLSCVDDGGGDLTVSCPGG